MNDKSNRVIMENILACNAAWSALLVTLAATHSIDLKVLEKQIKDAQLRFVEEKAMHAAEALSPQLSAVRQLLAYVEKSIQK